MKVVLISALLVMCLAVNSADAWWGRGWGWGGYGGWGGYRPYYGGYGGYYGGYGSYYGSYYPFSYYNYYYRRGADETANRTIECDVVKGHLLKCEGPNTEVECRVSLVMERLTHPIMSFMVVQTPVGDVKTDVAHVRFPMVFPVNNTTVNTTYVDEKTSKTVEFSLFHSERPHVSGIRVVEPTCFEKVVKMMTEAKEIDTVTAGTQEVRIVAEIRNRD